MKRTPLRRKTPLRARSRPRKRATPEWTAEQWERATTALFIRQRGACDWCGKQLGRDGVRHHRMRRRDGGDTFPNVVLLHDHCHKHIHNYPDDAKARGFIVPTYERPSEVPLDVQGMTGQGAFWLTDDGRRTPLY